MSIYTKIHSLQKEIGAIKKDSKNPFFKSNYFDINALISTLKPLLTKHGLVIMQPLTHINSVAAIRTIIVDVETGEHLQDITPMTVSAKPQENGSAITYYRRYALQSMLLLEAEDDDGNVSSGNKKQKVKIAEDQIPF